tara:strand:+ start:84 stop:1001 length:918 start_codon:yes stop_codon:yes gene_type:complete
MREDFPAGAWGEVCFVYERKDRFLEIEQLSGSPLQKISHCREYLNSARGKPKPASFFFRSTHSGGVVLSEEEQSEFLIFRKKVKKKARNAGFFSHSFNSSKRGMMDNDLATALPFYRWGIGFESFSHGDKPFPVALASLLSRYCEICSRGQLEYTTEERAGVRASVVHLLNDYNMQSFSNRVPMTGTIRSHGAEEGCLRVLNVYLVLCTIEMPGSVSSTAFPCMMPEESAKEVGQQWACKLRSMMREGDTADAFCGPGGRQMRVVIAFFMSVLDFYSGVLVSSSESDAIVHPHVRKRKRRKGELE